MRILAVDDDDVHQRLLVLVLEENRYRDVALAGSANDALRMIHDADAPFDCFLLDIDMPGMNGIELCREIRALPGFADVPILMLTGMSDREHVEAAFSAGATDYVTKPINTFELTTRLRLANELLMQRRRIDALGVEIELARSELGTVVGSIWRPRSLSRMSRARSTMSLSKTSSSGHRWKPEISTCWR